MCLEELVSKKCIYCENSNKVSDMVNDICSKECLISYVNLLKEQLKLFKEDKEKLQSALTNKEEQISLYDKIKNYSYEIEITTNILIKLSKEEYPKNWGITKDVASSFTSV